MSTLFSETTQKTTKAALTFASLFALLGSTMAQASSSESASSASDAGGSMSGPVDHLPVTPHKLAYIAVFMFVVVFTGVLTIMCKQNCAGKACGRAESGYVPFS